MDSAAVQKGLEDLCTQCGTCCSASVPTDDGHQLVVKGLKCKFLLKKSETQHVCSVYETRFQEAPWCMSLMKGFDNQAYPSDGSCPYVMSKSYKGKVTVSDEEYTRIEPQIIKSFMEKGQPEWCSAEDWVKFIGRSSNPTVLKSLDNLPSIDTTTPFDKKGK